MYSVHGGTKSCTVVHSMYTVVAVVRTNMLTLYCHCLLLAPSTQYTAALLATTHCVPLLCFIIGCHFKGLTLKSTWLMDYGPDFGLVLPILGPGNGLVHKMIGTGTRLRYKPGYCQ